MIRERVTGEIIPISAEQSPMPDDDEEKYGVGNAIDLDFSTYSSTRYISEGPWLKLTLDKVHCVQNVVIYDNNANRQNNWTCSSHDCKSCVGGHCNQHTLTVTTVETTDQSSISDCKLGDSVKVVSNNGFGVFEIVIIGKTGKFHF